MPRLVSGLYCGHGRLSCSGQKRVTIFDSSQGTITKLSVNGMWECLFQNLAVCVNALPQAYSPAHKEPLTCVFHNLGMVATGSKDGTVAIHSPAPGHTHLTTLEHHRADVTGLDCSLASLAVSSSDLTVSLWTTHYLK